MLTAAALVSYALACNPGLPPKTLARRIVAHAKVESGIDPLAIHDNATDRSYHPASIEEAIKLTTELIAAHHSIDGGALQINSGNWQRFGLTVSRVFDPQANVCAAARHIAEDYALVERQVSCLYVSGKTQCPPSAAKYPDLIEAAGRDTASVIPASAPQEPAACAGVPKFDAWAQAECHQQEDQP